jgi:hypothetical protein
MRTVIGMSLLLFVFACESDTKVGEGEKNITADPLSYSWSLVEQTEFIAATTFFKTRYPVYLWEPRIPYHRRIHQPLLHSI